jgi:aspartyl-tRNA synthetase
MAFVEQEDVIMTFEGLIKHLFKSEKNILFEKDFPRITYQEAIHRFGSDKPDIRFGMEFNYIKESTEGFNFKIFDDAESVIAICVKNAADYSRKKIDSLTNWLKRPQIGAKGLIYVKCNEDGTFKSSVDKFYDQECLSKWAAHCKGKKGDLILVLSGGTISTQKQMNELRLKLAKDLSLYKDDEYSPVWVVDFPLLEKDEETGNFHAMHHPFTSPKPEDIDFLQSQPEKIRANAYDLAINGVEVGGGSIRIHDRALQEKVFSCLGFSKEEAESQFGFLLNAFEYGAPPHGGIAFGFDRLCALMGNQDSIRDFIAFPKNNSGRDTMIDAPSILNEEQKNELGLMLKQKG